MLEICSLPKRFNGVPAVEDVSFTVRPGEIVGYLGPNGAGEHDGEDDRRRAHAE